MAMKLFNITDIFNNIVTMSPNTLEAFHDTLKDNYKTLKKAGDLDNLRVLRNRIATIIENNSKKFTENELQKIKKIRKLLRSINDTIEEMETDLKTPIELIDVVEEVRNQYKPRTKLPPDKRATHVLIAMKKENISYEEELIRLQLELVKLQSHIIRSGQKLLIIFEGRDAAGKGGTIKRFTEMLNPRNHRVVALPKPSDVEQGQWYFERYVAHLPNAGEMVFFDRSWYNRAGVEPVMGFVGRRDYEKFMDDVPVFERLLNRSNIKIIKFYFSVSKDEQAKRFADRKQNPLKQYKLSPVDQFSQQLWDRYSLAEYKNFSRTHSDHAPWVVINSDDKKKARINAIKYLLAQYVYPEKIEQKFLAIDDAIIQSGTERAKELKKEIDEKKSLFD